MKTLTKIAFKKAQKLADEIFGKDKKFLKKATIDSHLILGAKNMLILFTLYHFQKFGKAKLSRLSKIIQNSYYHLEHKFLQECQTEDYDTDERIRDYAIDEFLVFLKQLSQDNSNPYISGQARFLTLQHHQNIQTICLIYNNYMQNYIKKIKG